MYAGVHCYTNTIMRICVRERANGLKRRGIVRGSVSRNRDFVTVRRVVSSGESEKSHEHI